MHTARKHLAMLLCVCLLLVSVLSSVFIAEHLEHDCHGGHCEICVTIAHFQEALKQLGTAVVAVAMVLAAVYCLGSLVLFPAVLVGETPISLKARMNN